MSPPPPTDTPPLPRPTDLQCAPELALLAADAVHDAGDVAEVVAELELQLARLLAAAEQLRLVEVARKVAVGVKQGCFVTVTRHKKGGCDNFTAAAPRGTIVGDNNSNSCNVMSPRVTESCAQITRA